MGGEVHTMEEEWQSPDGGVIYYKSPKQNTLKPTPKTVAWGYYDAKAAPKTVASGYYDAQ